MPWTITTPPDRTTAMIGEKAFQLLAIRTQSDGDRTDFLLGAGDTKPAWTSMDLVEKTFHPIT